MKRTLPIIIILISLSLLGLIILQTSWLRNLLEVRQGQLFTKVNEACVDVMKDMSKTMEGFPGLKIPKRLQGLRFEKGGMTFVKRPNVEEHFSKEDVLKKLKAVFEKEDLKYLHFEFAITNSSDEYEMQSDNFTKEFWDTLHNKIVIYPFISENETDLNAGGPYEHLVMVVPDFKKQVWDSLRWVLLGGAAFMLIIISAFYITVTTLLNQKKLSEIKSDFINNMTHEFKTPLATISLAIDAIRNEKVQQNVEKLMYFSNIIKEENKRMNKHVETILKAALMEKKEINLDFEPVSIHNLLKRVLDNYDLQLVEKEGEAELELKAINDVVQVDELHFSNVISNLIDNAIKYSKDHPHIIIRTYNKEKSFVIEIKDNGIGMSKETVKRIFEKFYRAHTGNLHNVKGFGLGMSYVKNVIDAHKGKIHIESILGTGSTFTIEINQKV